MDRHGYLTILIWTAYIVVLGLDAGWDRAWDFARITLWGLLAIPAVLIWKWVERRRTDSKKKSD